MSVLRRSLSSCDAVTVPANSAKFSIAFVPAPVASAKASALSLALFIPSTVRKTAVPSAAIAAKAIASGPGSPAISGPSIENPRTTGATF